MTIQKYPVGLQDFGGIRMSNYLYVDKTMHINNLLTSNKYYFLSRPRRFGKSLLISTLECVLKGKKDLFEGLYIYDKWDFEEYPVIRISFSNIGYRTKGLQKAISDMLIQIADQNAIVLKSEKDDIANGFDELIKALYEKYNKNVVVLIDEYDKPIIDYLDQESIHKAHENRGVLKTFYSILKDAEPYLKLVFITGVSKFSQVSIFSDLNNLYDISMKKDYNDICGISQKELDSYFDKELEIYNREKIRLWYNGYRWHIDGARMYNPFSLMNFFSDGEYRNYWFSTGTPTFIVDLSKANKFYDLQNIQANSLLLSSFDIDNLEAIPVLFQTGYLTLQSYDSLFDMYNLDYPNHEVKSAFLQYLAKSYMSTTIQEAQTMPQELIKALKNQQSDKLEKAINNAFAHIPYPLWQKENEHFYHAIIHLLFSLLGVYIQSEVHTKDGRADAIILYEDHVYCLEFKLNKTAEAAIQQVKDKGYLDAYRNKASQFHIIGINFDSEKRKVDGLIWEVV
jgi:Predicted AAA-ATPase/PD-(D/E)XK nuclease superfamily